MIYWVHSGVVTVVVVWGGGGGGGGDINCIGLETKLATLRRRIGASAQVDSA